MENFEFRFAKESFRTTNYEKKEKFLKNVNLRNAKNAKFKILIFERMGKNLKAGIRG